MGLFVPYAFAAGLDDPVQPQTPTIRTELQAGYRYGESLFKENIIYTTFSIYNVMMDRASIVERDKSPAYQLGYWFSFRYLIFKNKKYDEELFLLDLETKGKINRLLPIIGIELSTVCECFGIKYEDYVEITKRK